MDKFTAAIVSLIIGLLVLIGIGVAYLLQPREYLDVELTELIEHPDKYVGKDIHTIGYLGDTGEIDVSAILIPIIISTGKTTTVIWVPLRDTDYYFAVYTSNSFEKGILIRLEVPKYDLLGQKVDVHGHFETFAFKYHGEEIDTYIIRGDVEPYKGS